MGEHLNRAPDYKSFWLRCWQGGRRQVESQENWRFSLEDPVTGQKRGFTDLQALVSYLESELDRENQMALAEQDAGSFQGQR